MGWSHCGDSSVVYATMASVFTAEGLIAFTR